MLKIVDRSLGCLLLLGGVGHTYGSFRSYAFLTPLLVWALSGSLAVTLLAAVNLVRANRSDDRALAWVSFAGCLGWIALAIAFGFATRNVLDPRVIYHVVVSLGLAGLSLGAASGRGAERKARVAQNLA